MGKTSGAKIFKGVGKAPTSSIVYEQGADNLNRAQRRAQKHMKPRRVVVNRTPGILLFSNELQDMILADIQAAAAFRGGWAEPYHFDMLVEGCVIAGYAANDKLRSAPDEQMIQLCKATTVALQNIRQRYDEKGKLGATGEEMAMLELFAQTSADFWPRQSTQAYRNAVERCGQWKRKVVTEAREARAAA